MTPQFPSPRSAGSIKFRLAVLLVPCLILISLTWLNPTGHSAQVSTATPGAIAAPALIPTATLHPIPELNPNPRQTDGVIVGAAVILGVILAGVWTYGRKRKE